jgi:hypothetical protein
VILFNNHAKTKDSMNPVKISWGVKKKPKKKKGKKRKRICIHTHNRWIVWCIHLIIKNMYIKVYRRATNSITVITERASNIWFSVKRSTKWGNKKLKHGSTMWAHECWKKFVRNWHRRTSQTKAFNVIVFRILCWHVLPRLINHLVTIRHCV